ncbi:hypothetical protein T440DRAFT_541806 [Plenodomus tracheiphilus IPT5]|uniref:RRM domain-containing protein n=1 Tax=Plenodomus tracheiphilus IPT5 TaxID=1408161 RepID=A0A6A7BGF4_9PLEO|nr:hypothetical protein T440DRAFT_541806 [Plenodomus tracheiphilus IPT5]
MADARTQKKNPCKRTSRTKHPRPVVRRWTDLSRVHGPIREPKSLVSKKPKVQENRAIYVANLPSDTTEEELEQTFKKYGIIDQGADGHPRIKRGDPCCSLAKIQDWQHCRLKAELAVKLDSKPRPCNWFLRQIYYWARALLADATVTDSPST